jgi:uncharacterized repeat protein (TIGR03803 family)
MYTKRFWYFLVAVFALAVGAAMPATTVSAAGTQGVVYNFTGGIDGGNAETPLAFDAAGNAYGATVVGGLYGCGTIFKLTPAQGQWTRKTLWQFTCGSDGKNPHGGVTLDGAGNMYGTTTAGGSGGFCTGDGCGVVFRLGKNGGFRTIYAFTGLADGFGPGSPVVFDAAGNIYGTAPDGGAHKKGVVYQLSFHHNHWQQTVLHAFTGHADGGVGSLGALLVDGSGNIFGVTEIGGNHSAGTAYEIAAGTWTFTTLYAFKGTPNAGYPYGGLIADSHGNLFGTTYYGGAHGLGSVFELKHNQNNTYQEMLLYSFNGGTSDGSSPTSTLYADAGGNLFGTTSAGGGTCDCGTIFKLAAGTGTESILHSFGSTHTDGAYPYFGLTLDHSGNLDTSTVWGGSFGQGSVYVLKP